MGCDLYIDRRVMPRHRRHRGSSLEQRPSKRASVPGPKNGPCFRRIVRFPRPMKEITTSRPFARLSILRCFPLQTRILVGVSISGSCAFLPAVRSVSSFFLSSFLFSLLLSAPLRSSPLLGHSAVGRVDAHRLPRFQAKVGETWIAITSIDEPDPRPRWKYFN